MYKDTEEKGDMGKVIGGLLGILVIGALVSFLLFHFGILSLGKGNGGGNENADVKVEIVEEERPEKIDAVEEITITVVVTRDEYYIDEQKVTLTQIKEKVTDQSAIITVVLEDNYASTKAWDDIKTSFTEWGIVPIEQ